MKRPRNKGISNLLGSILFLTIILTLMSTLFIALYDLGATYQGVLALEEERLQEQIALHRLTVYEINGTEYLFALLVNNTGSITSRIRAIYIDETFLCDPSNASINPEDTIINAKDARWILLPAGIPYEPLSKIAATTERGVKSIEYEYMLRSGSDSPSFIQPKFYYGPLELNFDRFYYTNCTSEGVYDPLTWKAGWHIKPGLGDIAWNLTVRNVDERDITINQFSCLTLWPNDEPSNRRAWYLEPSVEPYTQFIAVNQTVDLIYIWKKAKIFQMDPQAIYSTTCQTKVFLTFFGVFHELDGTTSPYGQTIPFEAVMINNSS